ncbi:SLC13 family permease [Pseudovibrio brasiliensis]|uniref:Anion permease n=1 Tax=Pseudovibrio brasiliensis TaxID=1898042 RepID=A0ABX8AY93_9HYPH|nr:SLC13 family permease [Pseudovibrio brasiliensis]QUS58584.1 anion permease [Pseudovibrio brasiliensis]
MTDHTQHNPPPASGLQPAPEAVKSPFNNKQTWQFIGVAVAATLAGFLASAYLPAGMTVAAVLSVGCLGLWATGVVPEYWTALAFFFVAIVIGIAPPDVVFSGFQTSTFWLLFAGLVLGASIKHTKLDKRAAVLLMRLPLNSYAGLISSIVAFSVALAFVVPSSIGRIMILLPVISALAAQIGFKPGSNGRTGMLCAAAFATFAPAFTILPANAPNMILAGMSESLYDLSISYWDYLRLNFPVLGVLKSLILIGLTLVLFPDKLPEDAHEDPEEATPVSVQERRLMIILALCLLFWLTDSLHPIGPAWVGLAAALACFWPNAKLTSKTCINQDLSYGSLMFVAGIMGLGAVISVAGLGEAIVQTIGGQAGFSEDSPIWNLSVLTGLSTLVAMATNLPGVPAVMTPVAGDLAEATGLPLQTVLMTQVMAFSNVFLPFQAPPLVAAIQVGNLPPKAVIKLCLTLFVISLFLLVPIDLMWWYLLGFL